MKKRTIAMLLALLLVLSLTAACGSSGTDTQPSSPAEIIQCGSIEIIAFFNLIRCRCETDVGIGTKVYICLDI